VTKPSEFARCGGLLGCEMCVVIWSRANRFIAATGTSSETRQRSKAVPATWRRARARARARASYKASRATATAVDLATLSPVQP
jgi:hypothetical protein